MNDELEIMQEETVVAYFRALPRNSPEGTEENQKTSVQIFCVPTEI
jgi:hypothetical protein